MTLFLELTDRAGHRELTLDREAFLIGTARAGCDLDVDIPGFRGRLLEVECSPEGRIRVRAEPGLPFPIRSASGSVGARFEAFLDGDVLNVGPALIKMRWLPTSSGAEDGQELDPEALAEPGSPVGSWYETFMEVADTLEGVTSLDRMVRTAMDGILAITAADRVYLELDAVGQASARRIHAARHGSAEPFRVSRSLVEQARASGRVVHVPLASADPAAARLTSVRREGISASIALPLRALGKTTGVLYADCVREGGVLSPSDLQRVVIIGRLLASALGNRDLVSSLAAARVERSEQAPHPALQTRSAACRDLVERVLTYAPTDYTVLLRGETGSGKEVIARALHDLSKRAKGPFVPVNCAAIPEQLMESMLFGHEKGSFTGAAHSRRGHFEEAHGGTILLDEIGDMSFELQAKILRVLQDRVVCPLGSQRQIKVDVRIIAATHQDLEAMVHDGAFRQDLYYRLRELELRLPSLRERSEDVRMLGERFLAEAAQDLGLDHVPEVHPHTWALLDGHPFPGNIRELRHLLRGAALRAGGGPVLPEHLDFAPAVAARAGSLGGDPATGDGSTWKERLEATERSALEETLQRAGGNLTKAAELFGVPRTTYREKLVKAGLLKS